MIFIVVTPARQLEGPAFNTPNVFVVRQQSARSPYKGSSALGTPSDCLRC